MGREQHSTALCTGPIPVPAHLQQAPAVLVRRLDDIIRRRLELRRLPRGHGRRQHVSIRRLVAAGGEALLDALSHTLPQAAFAQDDPVLPDGQTLVRRR